MTFDAGRPNDAAGEPRRARSAQPARRAGAGTRAAADAPLAPSARHPLVIAGNAVFTIILLVAIASGVAFVSASSSSSAGPARPRTRSSTFRAAGMRDIADLLARERRDRPALGVHRRRAGAQGARRPEIRRVPVPQAGQPARGGRDHRRRQGGAAHLHDPRGPDLGADRRAPAGERCPRRQHPRDPAGRHAAARDLSLHRAAPRASR